MKTLDMAANAFVTNLKAVKALILDEHKLVTYISLSKELCIHVNEAKSLLCQVIQDIRKCQPETEICVSYLISGLLNNNSGCTTVCPETDIDTLKKTLNIIFYEHVYCVTRGLNSVDNVALAAINKFEDLPLCTGLIKANSCIKMPGEEIENLKSKKMVVSSITKKTILQKNDSQMKSSKLIKKEHQDAMQVSEIKSEPNLIAKTPSPKKNTANNNKSTKINGNKTVPKSIAGFFSKVNGDSTKLNKTKVQEPEVKVKKAIKVEPISTDTKITPKVEESTISKVNVKNSLSKMKNAKVDKKRKRLLHVSDSESETEENDPFNNEMDVDHESEDEIPPTPTVNTVKITSGIVNPKKRRKIVDKTYTDEDGYILTKKEEVYESCSENEEDTKENSKEDRENGNLLKENKNTNVKENEQKRQFQTEISPKENKGKKKKVSPPQKGKQSTINSFFKKV